MTIVWCDGECSLDIVCGDRGIVSIRRESARSGGPVVPAARLDGPLEQIGDDAWRCAAAYGAARAGSDAPLKLRRTDDGREPAWAFRRGATSARGGGGGVVVIVGGGAGVRTAAVTGGVATGTDGAAPMPSTGATPSD